jgi:hypothetical protein
MVPMVRGTNLARSSKTLVAVGAALLGIVALPAIWPGPAVPRARYEGARAGPAEARRIYWVGHSLMSSRDAHAPGSRNVIETVDALAEAAGLGHASFDHTLWGSPLSLAYRGRSHASDRVEPELASRLARLREGRFDTLVLTDTVPIDAARRYEHTAYYAARFACEARARVPDARVYLYESFVGLHGLEDPAGPQRFDWTAALERERAGYEAVADEVSAGAIVEPGLLGRWTRWLGPPCPSGLVFLVPVGTALRALVRALAEPGWVRRDGTALTIADFFTNPYVDWPATWPDPSVDPSEARARIASLHLRHPAEPVDDIHPSALGNHFIGLVHFATLYRRSPEGLAVGGDDVPEAVERRLARLAWDVVRADPRSGVADD